MVNVSLKHGYIGKISLGESFVLLVVSNQTTKVSLLNQSIYSVPVYGMCFCTIIHARAGFTYLYKQELLTLDTSIRIINQKF